MSYVGALGGEYAGSGAANKDPEYGLGLTVPAAGVTHIANLDAASPGVKAWQVDYSAATGVAARVQLVCPVGLSNGALFSGVWKISRPGGSANYTNAGTVTYTATDITDTGQSAWGSAWFATQKIMTSDGKSAYTKLSAANKLLVFQDVALTTAGWNGGTPGAAATYHIVPAEDVYLYRWDQGTFEEGSLRLSSNSSGLCLRAYMSIGAANPGTLTQEGADIAVTEGAVIFLGVFAHEVNGEIDVWAQTDTVNIGATVISVTGLGTPHNANTPYIAHNATKGR
ncbi:MAG: hypothetical protein KGK07_17330, partial [Chloroflexota bacterium]|nr:hypothetical protein [Chloroflexota bacterium]